MTAGEWGWQREWLGGKQTLIRERERGMKSQVTFTAKTSSFNKWSMKQTTVQPAKYFTGDLRCLFSEVLGPTDQARATRGDAAGEVKRALRCPRKIWNRLFFSLADSAFYSFISHVLSANSSFIMRRRQRKCLFRKNIKKSAAGGKQSEEREEEMLRGYESDRGWKTKECQEGWGRKPVWRFLLLHRPPRTPGPLNGRIRDKREREREIHPSANEIFAVLNRGQRKWRTETGNKDMRPSWVSLHY